MQQKANNIKLLALDIDGVISAGKGTFFSNAIVRLLSEMNDAAMADKKYPPVTVITGRPATYIEAVLQMIHGFVPAIYEHGTGIYNPKEHTFKPHPHLKVLKEIEIIKDIICENFVEKNLAELEGGKNFTVGLFPKDKSIKFKEIIIEKVGNGIAEKFNFIYSPESLNIIPAGFHKGKGIEFLSKETGIALQNILGVGDSHVDIPFLQKTGFSAAPLNAAADVKKIVQYVSEKEYDKGLEDILFYFKLIPQN